MDAILKDTIERCPAPICIGLHQIDSSSKPYVVAEIGDIGLLVRVKGIAWTRS